MSSPSEQRVLSHEDDLFTPGHRACAGCAPALAMRHLTEATGERTIIAMATGCMEVISTPYPESAWKVSWIHDVFANAAGVASGIEAAYRAFDERERDAYCSHDDVNFVVAAGDGATYDIGIRSLSGMMDRGHDILYVCYDNEAYMNTGIQRSGATPLGASTTTSPPGLESFGDDTTKKDMPSIAVAHDCPYVATASIGYPDDFKRKVQRGLAHDGPAYLEVGTPCMLGWDFDPAETIAIAQLEVDTGLRPLYEVEHGELVDVKRIRNRPPVREYVEKQGRFDHLFEKEGGEEIIDELQAYVDERAEILGLDA